MRIGEMARASGTTTRAIRHYHRLGLMPEPKRLDNGYREYDLDDLVRLIRIRWYASAGIPLASIGGLLPHSRGETTSCPPDRDLAANLRAVLLTIENRISELEAQRTRLQSIYDKQLSSQITFPLPQHIVRVFDLAIAAASDSAGKVLKRDKESLESLSLSSDYRGLSLGQLSRIPDEPATVEALLSIYERLAAIEGKNVQEVENEIESLSTALARSPMIALLVPSTTLPYAGQSPKLTVTFAPDPAHRLVLERTLSKLTSHRLSTRLEGGENEG